MRGRAGWWDGRIAVAVGAMVVLAVGVALLASIGAHREEASRPEGPDVDARADEFIVDAPGMCPSVETALTESDPGPFRVACFSDGPEKVFAPPPRYPERARASGVEGVVIVRAVVEADGSVGDVEVLRGLPMGLDEAAVDAVRRWAFRPATLAGRPVAVYYNLTVSFRLE